LRGKGGANNGGEKQKAIIWGVVMRFNHLPRAACTICAKLVEKGMVQEKEREAKERYLARPQGLILRDATGSLQ